jgi:two-component system, chemotaxis family, sensor kinase Cph1
MNSGIRILLVEDLQVNQNLILQMLKHLGYQADAVDNGLQALEQLSKQTYDIVLMDCQMPVLDGYEATRQLRQQDDPHRNVIIIGVTAHALIGDREKCLDAGMNDYLSKPIRMQDLRDLLHRWGTSVRS